MLIFTTVSSKCFAEFSCDASPVIKTAFNGPFKEGETQTYILDDVDADIYDRLVFWIYTKTVKYRLVNGVKSIPPSKETQVRFDEGIVKLMKLWVLGDKLLMPKLQNSVVAVIIEMWELGQCHLESTSWISYIWDHTMVTSPIRWFVSARVVCWVRKAHCLQHSEDFPRELLMEVLFRAQETVKLLDSKGFNKWLWDMKQRESNWKVPEH
jgi:hypothetical protein